MSLRTKLFGAIVGFVVLLLVFVVALGFYRERLRAQPVVELRAANVRFAADVVRHASARSRELLLNSALFAGGKLHPRVRALALDTERVGAPGEFERDRWGPFEQDAELAARCDRMMSNAARTGVAQQEGPAIAVSTTRTADDGVTPLNVVGYVEMRSDDFDPAATSQVYFIAISLLGALLLFVTWLLLDRLVLRPLREVVRAAGRVAVGDYSVPVPETGRDDEIARVIESFNAMMVDLDRLQGRMKTQMGDVLAEARRTQDSLVIAQRLAATGRLAAGIAHEVNNPLAGMLEAVRALQSREMAPPKRQEYLVLIEEGLRRIQATVSRILQFTPHKVAPRPLTMDEIVRPVLGLARHRMEKLGVRAVVEGEEERAEVFGDAYELQQALLNLVLNALDALEDSKRERPEVLLRTTADEREVHLLVRDNGTGIREEDLPRVFDLFFTTKDPGKGTGLGLATAHKIVTDHGGRLDLRSRPGEGVDVELTLPRIRE